MHSVGWRWTTLRNWFPFSSISIGAKRLVSTLHSSRNVYMKTRPCAIHSIYHKTTSAYTKKKRITSPNILLFELGVNDEINKQFYSNLRFVLRLHICTRVKNIMDICTAHSMCRFVPSWYGANYFILYNILPPRNKMDWRLYIYIFCIFFVEYTYVRMYIRTYVRSWIY